MQHDALASVYAKSLFELAEQAGGQARVAEVNDELEQLLELTRSLPSFGRFLASPIINSDARRDVIRRLLDSRVTDLTLRFLLVLNEKGRLDRLESIADAFDHLVQDVFGRVEVDVFTAALIGDEAKAVIHDRIQSAIGKEPVIHTYADEDMIGGIKLRIGDQLIDGSVQTQLRRMRSNLLGSHAQLRERISSFMEEGNGEEGNGE